MTYIALIGDIIQSKQLTDRSKVQKTLAAYLDDLNKTFAPYIISKLSLTLGDEFQGLFQVDTPIFHLIDLINHHMDIPIRFGVGVGSIPSSNPYTYPVSHLSCVIRLPVTKSASS